MYKVKFLFIALGFWLVSCEPSEPATSNKIKTGAATDITLNSVVLHGEVNTDISVCADVEFGVMIATTKAELNARKGKVYEAEVLIGDEFELELNGLLSDTKYYYCAWLFLNNRQYEFGKIKSFKTKVDRNTFGVENGHKWVDLGLSVKWATCNVGATKPEEYGNYFAWGETIPKTTYTWSTYKWCNSSGTTMTKYCTKSSYGTVDNKTVLDLEDDAAAVNMGGSWRMPTYDELLELKTKCTWIWTNDYNSTGVAGRIIVSKTNGNHLFFPATGFHDYSDLNTAGLSGYYWSSSINANYSNRSYGLNFTLNYVGWGNGNFRYYGRSVRGVLSE